jgi:hypothetical protein
VKTIIRIIFIVGGIFFVLGCLCHLFPSLSGTAFAVGNLLISYSTLAVIALICAAMYGFGGTKKGRRR